MALTKTTTLSQNDDWAAITAGAMRVGSTYDLSGSFSSMLYIDVAPIEAVAQVGMDIIVQVSYADQLWDTLMTFKSNAVTSTLTTLDAEAAAEQKVISVATQSEDVGDYLFIKDGTIANSELIIVQATAAGEYTAADDLILTHANGLGIYSDAQQWVVQLPLAAAIARVLYNNTDTDCDMASSSHVSIVTSLT